MEIPNVPPSKHPAVALCSPFFVSYMLLLLFPQILIEFWLNHSSAFDKFSISNSSEVSLSFFLQLHIPLGIHIIHLTGWTESWQFFRDQQSNLICLFLTFSPYILEQATFHGYFSHFRDPYHSVLAVSNDGHLFLPCVGRAMPSTPLLTISTL